MDEKSADPLREALAHVSLIAQNNGSPAHVALRECGKIARAALANKPAEPAPYYGYTWEGVEKRTAALLGHPTESAGKSPEAVDEGHKDAPDRINLASLRRVMREWHSRAVSLGFDGVNDVLEQAGSAELHVEHWKGDTAPGQFKAQQGTWTLTAPDGNSWHEASPMDCLKAEMNDRIPPQVALARIYEALQDEPAETQRSSHTARSDEQPISDAAISGLADTRLETERGAVQPPYVPAWPQKRDLAASIRVSQQRYEIDVMWNNAIDLCRKAALASVQPPAPEPVGWLESPHGQFRANPLFRMTGPQTLAWSYPVYLATPSIALSPEGKK